MRFPKLKLRKERSYILDSFRGYRHDLRLGEGEFYDMENLSAREAPVLAPRLPRGVVTRCPDATGVTYTHSYGLVYTRTDGVWGIGGRLLEMPLSPEKKTFVHFGKYVLILPDMKYFNTLWAGDYGDVGYDRTHTQGEATLTLCRRDGEAWENVIAGTAAPDKTALWLDTSGTVHTLRQYSAVTEQWEPVTDTCVRLTAPGIGGSGWLYEGDVVTLSGLQAAELNGAVEILSRNNNSLLFSGILDATVTQDCATHPIRVERRVPAMDYVIEAGNRLWGCRFGANARGGEVNEIYASRLGDFRNWECFKGLSTDSWVTAAGIPGPFTGAANLGGNPVFYKENHRLKVFISATGAHQLVTQTCPGVQPGDGGSVVSVPGGTIYKSGNSIYFDNGATPVLIGDVFGDAHYQDALAHYHQGKYYVSMTDREKSHHFFTFDEKTGFWHREDSLHPIGFCQGWALEQDTGILWDLAGEVNRAKTEPPVQWMAQTGDLGLDIPTGKYLSRLTLRMSLEPGSRVSFWLKCDGEPFRELGEVRGTGLRSFSIPLRPRRCDHLRLMLRGEGNARVYAITKTVTEGGDPL